MPITLKVKNFNETQFHPAIVTAKPMVPFDRWAQESLSMWALESLPLHYAELCVNSMARYIRRMLPLNPGLLEDHTWNEILAMTCAEAMERN